jgi:hypothetical protein
VLQDALADLGPSKSPVIQAAAGWSGCQSAWLDKSEQLEASCYLRSMAANVVFEPTVQ